MEIIERRKRLMQRGLTAYQANRLLLDALAINGNELEWANDVCLRGASQVPEVSAVRTMLEEIEPVKEVLRRDAREAS